MIEKRLEEINFPEITEKEAREQYAIYPDFKLTGKGLLDVVVYAITDNGYLIPMRFSFQNKVLNIHELRGFIQMLEYNVDRIKNNFHGFNHFEGKPNYIYPDGLVVSIKKIVE